MATLYITEFRYIGDRGVQAAECPPLADQTVSIGGGSLQSAAFNDGTKFIRVHTDTNCSVLVGANPTATTGKLRIAAGQTEYFSVQGGQKIAVITN